MEYRVEFSETCLEEIEDICNYIKIKLNAENASNRLRRKIKERTSGLKYFPEMYVKIHKKDKLEREYRRIVIGNYILLYCIIEEDRTVLISHMYYGRKNYLENLI